MNLLYRFHNLVNYFATKTLLDKPVKDQLVAHLLALGQDQKEVAKNLRKWGFKGKINRWDGDPIHVYLSSKNPAWREITVHRSHITISYQDANNQTQQERVWPGENESGLAHLMSFIHDFDHGLYPELVS